MFNNMKNITFSIFLTILITIIALASQGWNPVYADHCGDGTNGITCAQPAADFKCSEGQTSQCPGGGGGGAAIPPDTDEDFSIPITTSRPITPVEPNESVIKASDSKPHEVPALQSLYIWLKVEIRSITSAFVSN